MAVFQKKKKSSGRVGNAVIFLIAFILFILVFGGLCLWVVVQINQEKRQLSSSVTPLSESTVSFTAADAENLLVITVDKEAEGFLIVRGNPAANTLHTFALPRETEIESGASSIRLFELYARDGAKETAAAIASLFKIELPGYLVITYPKLEKWITYLDSGLTYTVTEDLAYQDSSYAIDIKGGPHSLTASQVLNILRYPNWHGGRRQRAEIQSQLLAAMCNQYLVPSRTIEEDFQTLINLSQSNLKIAHFNKAKASLDYFASRNTGTLCRPILLDGKYVGSGEDIRFQLDPLPSFP